MAGVSIKKKTLSSPGHKDQNKIHQNIHELISGSTVAWARKGLALASHGTKERTLKR